MKILIAPDSFKGSIYSKDICNIGKKALEKALGNVIVDALPMADGGEGTVDSLVINTGGRYVNVEVTGPYEKSVKAKYGILGDEETSVVEMSSASGLALADKSNLNPMKSTSYGTGEIILDAVKKGCRKFIIGIGGSATNDCGTGMLQALGFEFLDKDGNTIHGCGGNLEKIKTITDEAVYEGVMESKFLIACDVDNPLIGPRGATMIYGPQKGADKNMVEKLEKGMIHFGQTAENFLGKSIIKVPGAGAAGGMGAAFYGFLNGELKSGFEIISNAVNLNEIIKDNNYDVIFTGEGKMDSQTSMGKLVSGISKLGKKYNIPVISISGALDDGWDSLEDIGLTASFSITNKPMSLDTSIQNVEPLIFESYYNIGKIIKIFVNNIK